MFLNNEGNTDAVLLARCDFLFETVQTLVEAEGMAFMLLRVHEVGEHIVTQFVHN